MEQEEKYLFNAHIFDTEEDLDDSEAPPPTYTHEEMEALRQKALNEGRHGGLQEAQQSREQKNAQVLEQIESHLSRLLEAENDREQKFEYEALSLCATIFEKLFPFYAEKHGMDEMKSAIQNILQKHDNPEKVTLSLPSDLLKPLSEFLSGISERSDMNLEIREDKALQGDAFMLGWKDGGAVRDTQSLADEISALLQQMLAGRAPKGHDDKAQDTENTAESGEQNEQTRGDSP